MTQRTSPKVDPFPPGSFNQRREGLTWITAIASLLMATTTAVVYLFGGDAAALAQLLYLPILLIAALFELKGAVVGVIVAAIVIGPLSPAAANPLGWSLSVSWLYQSALFGLFGLTVGSLFQATKGQLEDARAVADHFSGMYTKVLSSLANTVEVRDQHTQGHCERVADNALVLGRELGFSERELEVLYWSAMLHDLGKIAIPEYILQKQGCLTDDEYREIKRHPEYGADLLSSISLEFSEIASIVRAHHERWDGKGYPLKLQGEAIPSMSRIIAIVDVFEALTSERPYRSPMLPGQALRYIRGGAGTQFDPSLVTLFETLYFRGEFRYMARYEVLSEIPSPSVPHSVHLNVAAES